MKLKKTPSEILLPGEQDILNILEKINDILVVTDSKGEIVYSNLQDSVWNFTDHLSKIVTPVFVSSLKNKPYSGSIPHQMGRIKIKAALLSSDNIRIIITGNFDTARNNLLWNSFFDSANLQVSPLVEMLTGYNSAEINELPGKGFNLLNQEEAESVREKISTFIVDKSICLLELVYRITNKQGMLIWLKEVILAEKDESGAIAGYTSSLTELTNYVEEKVLNESVIDELRQLNHEKDQFISVLSHDLKSPYTSILGFSEILLNESSLSSDERLEYLSYINLSSQNQLKLINNLLEWSRLVTGRKHLDPVKINLKNTINNIISHHTRSIHKKNLDIKITADNYFFVEADERLLNEALSVMITNAVKYSHPGKSIEIFLNHFRENQVEVIIKDEGVGISEKNKSRILKMDQIFSTAGTLGERGTGISLLLAKEIIKAHNGEIWFYSEEGIGSEFHVTIPSAGNSILLVETEESEKQKICNMLKTSFPGFTLSIENNFYNALDRVKTANPVTIIFSHNMPFMNGIEFVRALKKEEKFSFVPIIPYSNDLSDKLSEAYREVGITEILSAPVNLKKLKEKIEELLK